MNKIEVPVSGDIPFVLEYVEFEEGKKHKKNNYQTSYQHDTFSDAGLLLDKRIVVIDIDNGMSREKLEDLFEQFNCRTMYTVTKRGFHLYYKKQKYSRLKNTEGSCRLGIPIEYKVYYDDIPAVCERRNGVTREMVLNTITEMPDIFKLLKNKVDDPYGMVEGDRNNILFKLNGQLNRENNISDATIRDILYFVNQYMFFKPMDDIDYILKYSGDTKDGSGSPIDIAYEVMEKFDTYYYKDKLMFKDGKRYRNNDTRLQQYIATTYDWLPTKDIAEVFKQCQLKSEIINKDTFPININNGHIINGEFKPYPYDGFTPFYIDITYNKDAPVDETVEKLFAHYAKDDEEYRRYLIQMITYPLIYDFDFKRHTALLFFIVGDGNNGKGTLLEMIRSIYTDDNTSSKTIEDLTDNHSLRACDGKLVNLGDDIEDAPIKERAMKVLKSMSTADYIDVRGLYKEAEDTKICPTMIFTSNHILKSFEKGNSWQRRVKWLPVYGRIEKKDRDFIKKLKTKEAKEYMFRLMIEELPELYNNGFIHCQTIEDFTQEYHKLNNNILEFLTELNRDEYLGVAPSVLYNSYLDFCLDMDIENPYKQRTFNQTVKETWGYSVKPVWSKVSNKTVRQYVEEE